jgi:hypothetical protein
MHPCIRAAAPETAATLKRLLQNIAFNPARSEMLALFRGSRGRFCFSFKHPVRRGGVPARAVRRGAGHADDHGGARSQGPAAARRPPAIGPHRAMRGGEFPGARGRVGGPRDGGDPRDTRAVQFPLRQRLRHSVTAAAVLRACRELRVRGHPHRSRSPASAGSRWTARSTKTSS